MDLFHNFPLAVSRPITVSYDNQLPVEEQYFTNVAAIQKWRYYNEFDSNKSLRVCY